MLKILLLLLGLMCLADIGTSLVFAILTLRAYREQSQGAVSVLGTYSVSGSALDVAMLSLLHVVALLGGLATSNLLRQRKCHISWGLAITSYVVEALLLSKAIIIAIYGGNNPLPASARGGPKAPLQLIFIPLLTTLFGSFLENQLACAIIARWSLRPRKEGCEEAHPLLGKQEEAAPRDRGDPEQLGTLVMLAKLTTPDWHFLMLAFSAGGIAALGQALIPDLTGKIIDYASIDPNLEKFQQTILRLLGVAAVTALFTGTRGGIFTVVIARFNVRMRSLLFANIIKQEVGFFDVTKTGDLLSRLSADTSTVADTVGVGCNVLVRAITQAVLVLIFMLEASWRLTVLTTILLPLNITLCRFYGAYFRKLAKLVQEELSRANTAAEEGLSSITTVRACAAEGSLFAAYRASLAAFVRLQIKEAFAYGGYMLTNTLLPNCVNAATLLYGGHLVLGGAMSAGGLVSFMLYQQSLNNCFQSLGDVFSELSGAVGAADQVVVLMQRQPKIPPAGRLIPLSFEGQVDLADVRLSYPARPDVRVLNGVTIGVEPGKVLALVGPSGGGKSSVVKLLQRFYLPSSGQVLYDGRDVGAYEPRWLRRRVGFVAQEPTLYARSVRRNICYGLEEVDGVPAAEVPTQEDIEEAAKLANAHNFITALPDGYETDCGEKGVTLSGGQKQRIAIARALVRRPSVLLLDEATSALDSESEAIVQEALDRAMLGHTTIVIAHRLSTVYKADRIVVIDKGRVVEQGTHSSLCQEGGLYAALVRRQFAGTASQVFSVTGSSSASLSAMDT